MGLPVLKAGQPWANWDVSVMLELKAVRTLGEAREKIPCSWSMF